MLTTDSIYYKPLLPVITIKNTANNTILYSYNSFTDVGTTDKIIYCSVKLSQNTHGEFTIQFEDQTRNLEDIITVGSRVQIDCGKVEASLTRVMSGIVRKKGYSRGANNKVLYTVQGSSMSIRFNEKIAYAVLQARKLNDGSTIDMTDPAFKADILLQNLLSSINSEGLINTANLAANSDVETFVPSINIEYGEVQDIVNYIEQQSSGEVVVDTNDLINFRYEIKPGIFGRGFTIKNDNVNKANDDADDTMYMIGKNWSYDDSFYKSDVYSNEVYALIPADRKPSSTLDLGFATFSTFGGLFTVYSAIEYAIKFRPTHTRFIPEDLYLVVAQIQQGSPAPDDLPAVNFVCKICRDLSGVPMNTGGIVAVMTILSSQFASPPINKTISTIADSEYSLVHSDFCYNIEDPRLNEFYLDMTRDYWLILSNTGLTGGAAPNQFVIGKDARTATVSNIMSHGSGFSTTTAGGTGWISTGLSGKPAFEMNPYRANAFHVSDPKAVQAIQSGMPKGLTTSSTLSELSSQIETKEAMYRTLTSQLYTMTQPRTSYSFPSVLAPNIPVFPGDPIVISDTITGMSQPGNQVVLTKCGDMSYDWGSLGAGGYDAPTILNIQAIGVHPRYV